MSDLDLTAPRPFDLDFDGRQCNVIPLSAKLAREVSVKLLGVYGRSLRAAAHSNARSMQLLELIGLGNLLDAAASENLLEWLHDKFVGSTQIESGNGTGAFAALKGREDIYFSGAGMGRWLRWLTFNVEVNCESFFVELRQQGPKLLKMTKSETAATAESPSPTS